jgi:hypothetical protein
MDNLAPQPRLRFESLLDHGLSREKAARILAAEAGDGEPELFEDWIDDASPPAHPVEDRIEELAERTAD